MSKYHSLRATLNYFDGIFQISRHNDDHILYNRGHLISTVIILNCEVLNHME